MVEKTKDWLSESTLKKVADLTIIPNKMTTGMIFNPKSIDKDPHEIMAEELNISSQEAMDIYKTKVANGTYVPPKEPSIIELRE